MDIELYEHAKQMFDKQVKRMGPKFQEDVEDFEEELLKTYNYYRANE